MKKTYTKPELDLICFEVEDVIAASGEPKGVLDFVSDTFEKGADGVLSFFSDLGSLGD